MQSYIFNLKLIYFSLEIHPERPNPFHEYTNKHENNYSIMELEITAESFLYKVNLILKVFFSSKTNLLLLFS